MNDSSVAKCSSCKDALTVEVEIEEDDESTTTTQNVPDDVQLSCGDHFHWQCLLDSTYELSKCPVCIADVSTHPSQPSSSATEPTVQILVTLNNEGGLQENVDLFPILHEECYLKAFPEERKCRAFLEFCREGDHRAVVELLQSVNDPDGEGDEEQDGGEAPRSPFDADAILRYQDPLAGEQSALHAAAANGHREIAWLLLLLGSSYPELEFPALVFQEAATLGIMRTDQTGKTDIRTLHDAKGRSAEDVAVEIGDVIWTGWIGNGRLALS